MASVPDGDGAAPAQAAFWRGRRVLVTGHTGFKGSWLCLWLHALGAEVTGFAGPPPTEPSLFDAARVHEGLTSLTGDVRDLGRLVDVLRRARPEVVVHLAAQPIVRRSHREPVETFATNVLGTVNLLEAVRTAAPDVRAVVSVTSDKCYRNVGTERGYREDDALGGRDPYSSSKACQELVSAAYRDTYFAGATALATARAGNVIGGGDWAQDRLVPDLMRAALAGRPVTVRSPDSVRPWQHVLNPLSGYLRLAERLWDDGDAFAEAWNFGPEAQDARPVAWMVEHLRRRWPAALEVHAPPAPPEADGVLRLDASKARTRLGWAPRWTLADGLDATVEWYAGYRAGADVRALTLAQIERFAAA